jgi:hypothetical protein
VVPIGGHADDVHAAVDLTGDVVVNERYGEGCSSSIAAALATLDSRCAVLVLLLGDQPGVTPPPPWAPCWPAAGTRRWPSAATTTAAAIRWPSGVTRSPTSRCRTYLLRRSRA